MSVLDIESAGFQSFEHRFNGPSFLVSRQGILRSAEGNEDLRLKLAGLVFDYSARQVAEFTTDTVDAMQNAFFPMLEVGEDMLGADFLTCPWIFHPEVVTDADMVLDSVVIEPFEPFISDELTVCDQTFDTITTKQTNKPLHDIDSFRAVGVPSFGKKPEQYGERHMIIRYAQN